MKIGAARGLGLAIFLVLQVALAAAAQELPVGENVTARARPESDALGLPLGVFRAYPKLAVRGGYDDNILATDSGTEDDFRVILGPSLLVESNWLRHSLAIGSFVESRFYGQETREDSTDWGVGAKGRVAVPDPTNLGASVNYQNLTEDRSGVDAVTGVPDPTRYDQLDGSVVLNHTFNRLTASVAGNVTHLRYRDNDQDYRDRDILRGVGQLGYTFSPGYSAFVRGTVNDRDYRTGSATTIGRPKQDSLGYEVVGGVSSQLSNLISGEAFLGYLAQNYANSAFNDVDGFSFGVGLNWSPTTLTTVRTKVSRDVVDSTAGGAGGILHTTAGLGVDHALTRDIRLRSEFSYYLADYRGISREDDGFRFSAGIRYRLMRFVHLDAQYRFQNRDSNASGQDFDRNQVDLSVEFQL